ncbi:hypothetical protein H6785_02600 [Candidatus Nomurabacteria bacterium]|nr:hypothetical protein [Candidatus Nomurabacteria bacterium]
MDDYSIPKKMKRVGDLFFKYKSHIKAPQATVEKACVEAIFKVTGFKIKKEDVRYTVSTKTLNLKIPSVLKSEVKFKYLDILEELKKTLGEKDAPNTII